MPISQMRKLKLREVLSILEDTRGRVAQPGIETRYLGPRALPLTPQIYLGSPKAG